MLCLESVKLEPLEYKQITQDSAIICKLILCGVLKHLVKIRWNL